MKRYVVLQEDENDCGACSLLSIIKYYNGYVPLEIIKSDTLTGPNGTSFYNLKEASIKYGFDIIGVSQYDISNFNKPFIAQLKINDSLYHFVTVFNISSNVLVMDPAKGLVYLSIEEFNELFTGNALLFSSNGKIIKYRKNKHFINLIKNIILDNKILLILLLFLSILLVFITLLNTYSIKLLINNFSKRIIFLFIILIILKLVITYINNLIIAHLNKVNNNRLTYDYISYYFYLPFRNLQLKKSGEIISRLNDLDYIKEFLSKELINFFIYLLFIIFSTLFLIVFNYKIYIFILLITVLFFIISYKINKTLYKKYLDVIDSRENYYDKCFEYINNIFTIKSLNKSNYFLNIINNYLIKNSDSNYILDKSINIFDVLLSSYDDIIIFLIIFLGLIFNLSFDDVILYILFFNYFSTGIKYYMSILPSLMHLKGIYNRFNGIYYLSCEKSLNKLKINNFNISISNLYYKYNIKYIFNNFNLNINSGDKVLLIGNNGSGKTTLLNILFNNILDYEGIIKIGNFNIKDIGTNIRDIISFVKQDDNIFVDSLLNNIILDLEFNEFKFNKIIELVDLDSFIKNKCNGYNFLIKNNISGGERQKIILARALYKNFNILFLDEALSEISYCSRLKIINNINNFYKDKTIIYVSHFYEKFPFDKIINITARKDNNVKG